MYRLTRKGNKKGEQITVTKYINATEKENND